MKNKKCAWYNECRNGDEGCWSAEPNNCVRFMPIEGTNLTEIDGIVETPPNIDYEKFSQYFMNWIDSMGWSFCGSFAIHKDEINKDEKEDEKACVGKLSRDRFYDDYIEGYTDGWNDCVDRVLNNNEECCESKTNYT